VSGNIRHLQINYLRPCPKE